MVGGDGRPLVKLRGCMGGCRVTWLPGCRLQASRAGGAARLPGWLPHARGGSCGYIRTHPPAGHVARHPASSMSHESQTQRVN